MSRNDDPVADPRPGEDVNDDPVADPRPGEDVLDPAQFDTEGSDVGGPDSALGSGVDAGLTGGDVESGDEGRASTQPRPSGD